MGSASKKKEFTVSGKGASKGKTSKSDCTKALRYVLGHFEGWVGVFLQSVRVEFIPDSESSVRDWAHNLNLLSSAALPIGRIMDLHGEALHRDMRWDCRQALRRFSEAVESARCAPYIEDHSNEARLDSLADRLRKCGALAAEWKVALAKQLEAKGIEGLPDESWQDSAIDLIDMLYVPSREYLEGQLKRAIVGLESATSKLTPHGGFATFIMKKQRDELEYPACTASRWLYLVVT